MTDKIKLTDEEIFEVRKHLGDESYNKIKTVFEKAEKWDKKIQFWIKELDCTESEAEKYQSGVDNSFIKVGVEQAQEIKQLKDSIENYKRHFSDGVHSAKCAGALHDVQQVEIKNLKQKLEKIKELSDNDLTWGKLKEILNGDSTS